jgi:hypothetical protein
MSGTLIPTLVLPLLLTAFIVLRLGLQIAFPMERGLVFPMALVPALWGAWNMLWEWSHERTRLTLGLHGAILPLLLMPAGAAIATFLGILALGSNGVTWFQNVYLPYAWVAPGFLAALAGYYLAWKYVVGYVDRVLGIA